MLKVEGLSISYGGVAAVRDFSMQVDRGGCAALIGANGAGKSSVLRGILGLAGAKGHIQLDDVSLERLPSHQRVRAGLALSPEGRHVFGHMTVADNLEVGAASGTAAQRQHLSKEMGELFPRLHERRHQLAGSLSGGEQQMLAIARALMSRPKLLMLDEPTLGLAPIIVDQLVRLIERLRAQGLAILLAEQNAVMALESSDVAYVMETGLIKRHGASRELAADPAIRTDYLGY